MKIILANKIYDITEFINVHPGGSELFINNSDMTEKFNESGHSSYAISLLGNFKPKQLDNIDPRYCEGSKLSYNQTKISKLFTHEDKFNIHKICGLIVLINFISLFIDYCLSGFVGEISYRKMNIGFMALSWIHGLLSLSSFQFLVPKSRTGILPMIWQEFRAHSSIFALRSIIIMNLIYFCGSNQITDIVRFGIVCLTMYLADTFTNYLRSDTKESTTASMPYWTGLDPNIQNYIKIFYTHAQFMATCVCLNSKISYILYIVFPIQLAAFLMTLVRKNIISAKLYHILYGLALLSGYIINFFCYSLYFSILIGFVLYYLRIICKINKYYMWFCVFALFHMQTTPIYLFTASIIYLLFGNNLFEKSNRSESNNIVVSNKMTSSDHYLIKIKSANKLDFKPGQYINLYYNTEKRPYTPIHIDSKTNEIEFLIKSYTNGKISPQITENYLINSVIYLKGPFGTKYYSESEDLFYSNSVPINKTNILMFSCGTGITPFYSMIQNLSKQTRYKIHLYSSFKSPDQSHLFDSVKDHSNLSKYAYFSSISDKLNSDKIDLILKLFDLSDCIVFICGTNFYNQMITQKCSEFNIEYIIF